MHQIPCHQPLGTRNRDNIKQNVKAYSQMFTENTNVKMYTKSSQ